MTNQNLIKDFLALQSTPEDDRRSELSYLFMQTVARIAEEKGWNMAQLAEAMGAHRSQVSRWLNGSADVRLSTIAKFEVALQTPIIEVDREESFAFAKRELPRRPPAAILDVRMHASEFKSSTEEYHWGSQPHYAIAA